MLFTSAVWTVQWTVFISSDKKKTKKTWNIPLWESLSRDEPQYSPFESFFYYIFYFSSLQKLLQMVLLLFLWCDFSSCIMLSQKDKDIVEFNWELYDSLLVYIQSCICKYKIGTKSLMKSFFFSLMLKWRTAEAKSIMSLQSNGKPCGKNTYTIC